MENKERLKEEIKELEDRIDGLKKRLPAHSISVKMMQDLEDLEDEINKKRRELEQ